MKTRAKMVCNRITLNRALAVDPKYKDLYDTEGHQAANEKANEDGEPLHVPFDQPTVELIGVTDGSPENKAFFAASPAATVSITISNPDAAGTFELGKEYYVDFSPADAS